MTWLALDVGGANLKAADGRGYAAVAAVCPVAGAGAAGRASCGADCRGAAVRRDRRDDDRRAGRLLRDEGRRRAGDCRRAGRRGRRAGRSRFTRPTAEFVTPGKPPRDAACSPRRATGTRWPRSPSRFAAARPALLVDIGSTTADIIPLDGTAPAAVGPNGSRAAAVAANWSTPASSERRSRAIVSHLPWRGDDVPRRQRAVRHDGRRLSAARRPARRAAESATRPTAGRARARRRAPGWPA